MQLLAERPLLAALLGGLGGVGVVGLVVALVLHGRSMLDVAIATALVCAGGALFLLVLAVNAQSAVSDPAKRGSDAQRSGAPWVVTPFAAALQPDFGSFFDGMEVAVVSGFVVVVGLVVVHAVKKMVSF